MKVYQEEWLTMYRSLISFFNKHAAAIAAVPALSAAVTQLKNLVAAIDATLLEQTRSTIGVTISKEKSADVLINLGLGVAGSLSAWAGQTGNEALRQDMRLTPSKLRRLRAEALAPICARIYEEARKNLPALAAFNVTEAQLDALQQALAAYTTFIPAPRNAKVEKSTTVANLNRLFKQTNVLIKEQIDQLMRTLIQTNPALGDEYLATRTIVNIGKTSTQLKVTVNTADGKPVKGVSIELKEPGITALTNSRGRVLIRPIAAGVYLITVKATGFKPQTLEETRVVQGRINNLAIVLEPE